MQKHLIPHILEAVYTRDQISDTIPEGVALINAPDVWKQADYGNGTVVAVIDTGIDINHPDLEDRIIGGEDFSGTGSYEDDNGHGTHVSGTILAAMDDNGLVGVAPKAKALSLKALNSEGSGQSEDINAALQYAIDWRGPAGEKVSVISMSLGGPADEREHELIQEAVKNNILVVCAAGNSGDGSADTDEMDYPGAYPEVIEVGAVDMQKRMAPFSNSNKEVDVVAPGVGIISCYPGGKYAKMSGTSMATPHVSGAAALLVNLTNRKTEEDLYQQVIRHTENLGAERSLEGHGLINLSIEVPAKQNPPTV